jgi:ferredoxin--NADP+ reductase
MAHPLTVPDDARHVVVIVGGAVAGSEAAALCAERGILALVIEQNARPFGKIEDGLPRWHDKLRKKEYEHISENLRRPGVLYIPRTRLGHDVTLTQLTESWGANAVLLASGAWRDRQLFVGAPGAGPSHQAHGIVNQNALVYWYNHQHEQGYDGPRFTLHDGAAVVGGGLASIDVVKIINFELYKRALGARGLRTTTLELEHEGIPHFLARHGLDEAQLGLRGVTLYYRREKSEMPLASPPDHATPQQLEKIHQVREKLMDKVIEKYLVHFQPNAAPLEPLLREDKLVGIRFQRTHTVDGKLQARAGETLDVHTQLVVSSIGSVPLPLPGLPMKGELIDFEDWNTGRVRGLHNVFGVGNVLTGKGNIKESRKNAYEIGAQLVQSYLGLRNDAPLEREMDQAHQDARDQAAVAVRAAEAQPLVSRSRISQLFEEVAAHWARSGYDGDYDRWMARVTPKGEET